MPPDILDGSFRLPVTDGSGRDRATLRSALKLLSEAGYELDGAVLRQRSTKAPLAFEILVTTRDQERIALAYQRDLKRAGIEASVRAVDAVQFDQRRLAFDFDMLQNRWDQSLSPGNEQSFYWGSEAAGIQGTRNYMGARDPAIDAMIAALLEARERTDFVPAVRALDRTLMSGFYGIPLFNVQEQWIARWNRIERPSDHCADRVSAGNLVAAAATPNRSDPVIQTNASPTLDGLFKRILARKPDAPALLDPLNKLRVTGQPPRNLTFAEADRAITALSAHFIESGLPSNSVIAVQLPNTVEFVLTVLAAHRAGLVVALFPLLWRQAELTVALNRTGARAIVSMSRVDGVVHSDLAMNAAAEAFSIRHVCGFGSDLPEGMASLDHALSTDSTTTRAVVQDGRKAAIDLVRRHQRRLSSGAAHASEFDRRRPRIVARKRYAAGRDDHVGVHAVVVRGPDLIAGGLAIVGRNAGAASSVRRRRARAADRRAWLRYAGRACATGVAAGRDRHAVAAADLAQRDRALARAGTGRIVSRPGRSNMRR